MAFKFIVIAAIISVAQAGLLRSDILPASTLAIDHASAHLGESHYVPSEGSNPAYEFKYGVHDSYTGDSKSAHEIRNGDFVQGTYSLNDADGTKRTVDYTATPFTGFEATVSKEPIIEAAVLPAFEPTLAKTFVDAPAPLVEYKSGPAFLGAPTILPSPAPPAIIEPHSFTRLALPATNLIRSNLHFGSDLRLASLPLLAPNLRYAAKGLPYDIAAPIAAPIHRFATDGLPIGLHEPVHRFATERLPITLNEPVHRFAAEGLPIGLQEPIHRFAAEGLPIGLHEPLHRYGAAPRFSTEGLPVAIPESVHITKHDAGLTPEVLNGFAAGVRSYTASAPTLLRSW